MKKKKELEITVSCGRYWHQSVELGPVRELIYRSSQTTETQEGKDKAEPVLESQQIPSFACSVHHNLDINVAQFELHMELPFIEANDVAKELNQHRISVYALIPVDRNGGNTEEVNPYRVIENIEPITRTIAGYHLTEQECLALRGLLFPEISPKVNEYFGNIIKRILEEQNYEVTVRTKIYYFPSPTSTELVAPAFSIGVAKRINPNRQEDYNIILTFFARQKTQQKTLIQLELSEEPTEEQLKQFDARFRGGLGPYGLLQPRFHHHPRSLSGRKDHVHPGIGPLDHWAKPLLQLCRSGPHKEMGERIRQGTRNYSEDTWGGFSGLRTGELLTTLGCEMNYRRAHSGERKVLRAQGTR